MPAHSECPPPRRAVPVIFVNGTADPLVPFDGGGMAERFGSGHSGDARGTVLAATTSALQWARLAGANAAPTTVQLPDRDPDDGSTVTQQTWTHRDGRPVVRLLRVDGGGHVEPSIDHRYARLVTRFLGAQNGDIESAEAIHAFFAGH